MKQCDKNDANILKRKHTVKQYQVKFNNLTTLTIYNI